MKKYYILFFLIFISTAFAKPTISNLTILPQEPWLGDNVEISFNCFEENKTIEKVQVIFLSPIEIPNSSLNLKKTNFYYFSLPLNYPYAGKYTFQISCESNDTLENSTQEIFEFTVFNLTAYIDSIKPGRIYEGDEIKVFLRIKKNDKDLNVFSNINIQTFLNNKPVNYNIPPYFDASRGWVLSFNASDAGEQKLKTLITVEGRTITIERNIVVHKLIDISFQNINKVEVLPNDVIILKFFAKERDYKIDNSSLFISLFLNSESLPYNYSTIDTLDGTIIEVNTKIKETKVGDYSLIAKLNYKGKDFVKEIKITQPIKIETKLGQESKAYNGKIKFQKENFERIFVTNSSGYFSGAIPKGKYDIEIEINEYPNYPGMKLVLNDTEINYFPNSITFDTLKDANIDGLGIIAIYMFDFDFKGAYLELAYDKRKAKNEIIVYKCDEWDFEKSKCDTELEEIEATIDKEKNIIKIYSNDFSVFIVSYRKKLDLRIIPEKKNYHMNDLITIKGYLQDEDENYVDNAKIFIKSSSLQLDASAVTDKNGYFSYQFLAPQREGVFKIEILAEKSKFIGDKKTIEVNITKSKKFTLFLEDSFRFYSGDNVTLPLKIINTGQSDFSSCQINISGLPDNFKVFFNEEKEIKSGEERDSQIKILTSKNLTPSTYILKIQTNCDNVLSEKQLLLTFEERAQQYFPTTKIILPKLDISIIFTAIICLLIILVTYFLKKQKQKNQRDDLLKQIKNEVIKKV